MIEPIDSVEYVIVNDDTTGQAYYFGIDTSQPSVNYDPDFLLVLASFTGLLFSGSTFMFLGLAMMGEAINEVSWI